MYAREAPIRCALHTAPNEPLKRGSEYCTSHVDSSGREFQTELSSDSRMVESGTCAPVWITVSESFPGAELKAGRRVGQKVVSRRIEIEWRYKIEIEVVWERLFLPIPVQVTSYSGNFSLLVCTLWLQVNDSEVEPDCARRLPTGTLSANSHPSLPLQILPQTYQRYKRQISARGETGHCSARKKSRRILIIRSQNVSKNAAFRYHSGGKNATEKHPS